jgi:diacylglycerol O-acyltransferase / wax synthase
VITNVPGPQLPLFAAGARLVASYPVLPLSFGHLLAIGVTSYNGEIFLGLNADRDAVRDLDVLAQCLRDALEELLDTTVRATTVRQPTRKAPAAARRVAAQKAAARQDAARKATAQKRSAVRNLVSRAAELDNPPAAPPPTKSTAESTAKGTAKSTAKGTAKSTAKGTAKSTAKSTAKAAKVRQSSDKSRQLAPQKTARKKPPPAKAVPEEPSAQDGPNR